MAKIRVYELAKKLNMTNKALLTKLKAMNIEAKSHMSSLEDDTEKHVRESMFGQKNKEADTRVKSSVIRRRRPVKGNESVKKSGEAPSSQGESLIFTTDSEPESETDLFLPLSAEELKENHESLQVQDQPEPVPKPEHDKKIEPKAPLQEEKGKARHEPARVILRPEEKPKSAPVTVVESFDTIKESQTKDEPMVKMQQMQVVDIKQKSEQPVKEIESVKAVEEKLETGEKASDKEPQSKQKETALEVKDLHELEANDLHEEELSSDVDANGKSMDTAEAKDKKRKKKKVQKRSEPAKIIKMAVPISFSSRNKSRKDVSPQPPQVVTAQPQKPNVDSQRPMSETSRPTPEIQRPNSESQRPTSESQRPGEQPQRPGAQPQRPGPQSQRPGGYSKPAGPPAQQARKFIPAVVLSEELSGNEAETKRSKKKDWKKKVAAPVSEEFVPKGAPRKRKSVVEGKDLYESAKGGKKGRKKDSRSKKVTTQKTQITVPKAIKRRIKVDEIIELSELAKRMGIKANEMIVKLMGMGVMVTVNQTIDFDTANLVAAEFDYEVEKASVEEDIVLHVQEAEIDPEKLVPRPPVVTIMGHVDHGKTSLLDVIRKTKVATGEAGGITQHIGAYSVKTPRGTITFLDTPGHAAFTSMRSRGAQVTDLVVLVVAADDGVMPQTIEAINHSKAANVPVVVAVNKMDKPGADPDRVMRELADQGLLAEDWGGDVIFAKVSAKTGDGIDGLLEMILLQSEVLELKANPESPATGHVIEARLDAGRGPVATILVNQGTLRAGQPVVCGLYSGKIRVMIGDTGKELEFAGPSTPVEIVGLSGVPEAGDEFVALESEKDAKQVSDSRMQKQRAKILAKRSRANLEKLFESMGADEIKELKLIIKADVHGSLEALNESIMKLVQDEVDITIVHSGTGAINESDVSLAAVSDAIILGFNVRPTPKVRTMAKDENVDMRFYDIIYNVINDIKLAITGLMPSTFHEVVLGRAEVRDTFVIPHKGLTIGGSIVLDGTISRGHRVRLLRDGVVKCDSTISSLRRFKDDVKEVTHGYECGIGIERYNDIKVGDIFECYEIEERKAQMEQIKE